MRTRERDPVIEDDTPRPTLMSEHRRLLLAFYGDDFTGSTDALEALSVAGVRSALFFEPPTAEELREHHSDLLVVGVAGVSRSMTPEGMNAELPAVFERIERLGAELFHYKICSTFDSAPEVGSIGRAIDLGQRVFRSRFVPVVVGAPALRRYTLFGNHFASVNAETFRLDRHPTMSRHPTTPMRESDLRIHLAAQTAKRIGSMDILSLSGAPAETDARLAEVLEAESEIVLFDVLDDRRLAEVGRVMWDGRARGANFVVGSSGVEYALAAHWRAIGAVTEDARFQPPGAVERLIVVSGSCSPVTNQQIGYALKRGFVGVAVDGRKLIEEAEAEVERVVGRASAELKTGRSVVIHTALGADDKRINETTEALRARGLASRDAAERIGTRLGAMLRTLIEQTGLWRFVVAGGDTSGFVARAIGVKSLEVIASLAPGAPLCRARLKKDSSNVNDSSNPLEIALKGGQLGGEDYFVRARDGS